MSKKFKKHTFIPWEKIAKKLNSSDIHLHLFEDELTMKKKWIQKTRFPANTDNIVEVGYGQYAFINHENFYFDLQYKVDKNPDCYDYFLPDYTFTNIDKPLKYFYNWYHSLDTDHKVTVKPIFKLVNPYTGEPYIGSPLAMPSGRHNAHFIGMLVKQKG